MSYTKTMSTALYTPPFQAGQSVTAVQELSSKPLTKTCGYCAGACYMKLEGRERSVRCPECQATGTKELANDTKRFRLISSTIGQVGMTHQTHGAPVWEFMLEETGVGSGRIWRPEVLFTNPKQAREWAQAEGMAPECQDKI